MYKKWKYCLLALILKMLWFNLISHRSEVQLNTYKKYLQFLRWWCYSKIGFALFYVPLYRKHSPSLIFHLICSQRVKCNCNYQLLPISKFSNKSLSNIILLGKIFQDYSKYYCNNKVKWFQGFSFLTTFKINLHGRWSTL